MAKLVNAQLKGLTYMNENSIVIYTVKDLQQIFRCNHP